MRLPLAPIACSLLSFVAGYVAFHPGWRKAAPLSDGSAESFRAAAEAISSGDLLEKASPHERFGWLLETCRQPRGYMRDFAMYEAVQRLQPVDFLAAFADLQKFGTQMMAMSDEAGRGLIREGIERWLNVDRDGALRTLTAARMLVDAQTLKLPEIGDADIDPLYTVLARREPEWMHQTLGTLGTKTRRNVGVRASLREMVTRNPQKAREWLDAMRGTSDGENAFQGYMEGLRGSDPRAALALALTEKDPAERDRYSRGCLEAAAKDDPALMLEMLSQIEPERRARVEWATFRTVLPNLASDPFAWVQERFAESPDLVAQAGENPRDWYWMGSLVRRDPLKTIDWVNTLPQDSQGSARNYALQVWGYTDPGGLLDWLTAQSSEKLPARLPNIDFSMIDPAKYGAWADALPNGPASDAMRLALSAQLANRDKVEEAMRVFPQDLSSEMVAKNVGDTVFALASRDLPGAVKLVNQLPEGPAQASAASGLIALWVGKNPQEAADWIGGLPVGASRDAATSALATNLAGKDPEAATEWLEQIGDPAVRATAIAGIFSSWPRTDAARFQWLQSRTDAPDSLKRYLLSHQR